MDGVAVGRVIVSAPSAGPSSPLSDRELQVARLVTTGATNREIASALSIAPKTVSAHVEHILRKLGVGRRTEIAAWAAVQASTGTESGAQEH